MTLVDIGSPFVDTRAEDLRFSLSTPVLQPVASTRARNLELRILGASHQVLVLEGPHTGLIETVAYLPEVETRLPNLYDQPGYAMATFVHQVEHEMLRKWVKRLQRKWNRSDALVARFAGDALALTAIQAKFKRRWIGWDTWHVYPQHGQIVETHTRLFDPTRSTKERS